MPNDSGQADANIYSRKSPPFRSWPHRGSVKKEPKWRGSDSVTVCIAVLFRWNYAEEGKKDEYRPTVLTASDRMLTAADVQYEPKQRKIASFGKSIALVAGDLQLHSEAILQTEKEIRGRDLDPQNIAQIYGRAMQNINLACCRFRGQALKLTQPSSQTQ